MEKMIALSKILNVTFDNLVSEHKISDETGEEAIQGEQRDTG